jgi:hypothetical protein
MTESGKIIGLLAVIHREAKPTVVMAGLDPAIHAFALPEKVSRGCPAHRRAEATPFFERLWPGMTRTIRRAPPE